MPIDPVPLAGLTIPVSEDTWRWVTAAATTSEQTPPADHLIDAMRTAVSDFMQEPPAAPWSKTLSYQLPAEPDASTLLGVADLFRTVQYTAYDSLYDCVFYNGQAWTRYDAIKWALRQVNTVLDDRTINRIELFGALGVDDRVMNDCSRATQYMLGARTPQWENLKAHIRFNAHGTYLRSCVATGEFRDGNGVHYAYTRTPLVMSTNSDVHFCDGHMAFAMDDVRTAFARRDENGFYDYEQARRTTADEFAVDVLLWPWWLVDFDDRLPMLGRPGEALSDNQEALRTWRKAQASSRLASRMRYWANDGRRVYDPNRKTLRSKLRRSSFGGLDLTLAWARNHAKEWPRWYVLDSIGANYTLPDGLYEAAKRERERLRMEYGQAYANYVPMLDWQHRRDTGEPFNPNNKSPWGRRRQVTLPWSCEWWWENTVNVLEYLHNPDIATGDPMQLSYWQSADKFHRDVRTTIKPGKYLKKYFGIKSKDALLPVLTDADIQKWAEAWELEFKPTPVFFKEDNDPEGWRWVYSNETGFKSCMSAGRNSCRGPEAVRVFAKEGNGLRLAYTTDNHKLDGKVTARCIVNEKRKTRGRVYGDARLGMSLATSGYVAESRQLDGVEIALIEYDADHWYLPYIDAGTESGGGSMAVRLNDDKTAMVVGTSGPVDANRYETALVPKYMLDPTHRSRGTVIREDDDEDDDNNTVRCDDCGAHEHPDDMYYSGHHELNICGSCIDGYRRAYVGLHTTDWVREDETVECDGEHYLDDSEVLSAHNLYYCSHSGDLCHQDDMVLVPGDDFVHIIYTTELDIAHEDRHGETYSYCLDDDAVELGDGTTVYHLDAHEWSDGTLHHVDDEEPEQSEQDTQAQAA